MCLRLGAANPLFLIAGPCVIESETHACAMAEKIARIASRLRRALYFQGLL